MSDPKPKKSSIGRRIALPLLIIAIAGSAWFAFRSRSELAFVGNPPPSLRAIPRSRITTKPWVNLSIGRLKLVYPAPHIVPPEFAQVPGLSGVLLSESATSPWQSASWTGTATWVVDGSPIAAGPGFLGSRINVGKADLWPCPYVFGKSPREVVLKPISLTEEGIHLLLPPNHLSPPIIEPHEVKGDGWTLRLKPKPWISPSFPIRFEVTIEGAQKDEAFLLAFTEALDGAANLIVRPDQPAELSFQNWSPEWGVLMQIQKVKAEKLRVSVAKTPLTSSQEVIRFSLDDYHLAEVSIDNSTNMVERENPLATAGYAAIQIGDFWPHGEFETRNTYGQTATAYLDATRFKRYRSGDIVDAIGYKGIEPFTQRDFIMKLPDPRTIVGTRAYSHDGPR